MKIMVCLIFTFYAFSIENVTLVRIRAMAHFIFLIVLCFLRHSLLCVLRRSIPTSRLICFNFSIPYRFCMFNILPDASTHDSSIIHCCSFMDLLDMAPTDHPPLIVLLFILTVILAPLITL